jgi:hypothetical protein
MMISPLNNGQSDQEPKARVKDATDVPLRTIGTWPLIMVWSTLGWMQTTSTELFISPKHPSEIVAAAATTFRCPAAYAAEMLALRTDAVIVRCPPEDFAAG